MQPPALAPAAPAAPAPSQRGLAAASIAAFALAATALRINPIFDPDYHWHLATGALVARTHAVPTVDSFSHTFAGAPWRFVDWLADLLMYGLWRLGGDALVVVAFALTFGVALASTLWLARRLAREAREGSAQGVAPAREPWGALFVTGALLVPAVAFRVSPRPQTLTFLLLALELAVLERARTRRGYWVAAPALVALWQNVHSSALLGWVVLVAFAAGTTLEVTRGRATPGARRDAWLAALLGMPALLLAAHPIDRLRAGFDHLGDARVGELFDEWAPIHRLHGFYPGVAAAIAMAAIVAASLTTAAGRRAHRAERLAVGLALTLAGLFTMRLLPLAAIALAPSLALAWEAESAAARRLPRWLASAVVIAAGGWLTIARARPVGFGLAPDEFPVGAASFVKSHEARGRLYNDFHYGGYLIWTLGAGYPVFVDGRSMALYGIEFVMNSAPASDAELGALLDRTDVDVAIAPTFQRTGFFQHRPGWALVYFDDVAYVAVRARDHAALAASFGYRYLDVTRWQERIEAMRAEPATIAPARAEAQRAIAAAPEASLPWVLLASVEIAAGDGAAADRAIDEALRRRPDAPRAHRAKLLRCLETHDRACACAAAAAVLRATPANAFARDARARLACE
jgi:hypothetical protein